MEVSALVVYFATLAAVTAAPGPLIAVLVARSMARDRSGAVAFAAGICAGDLIVIVVACAGLGLWAQSQPVFFAAARYAGAAYLLWLAARMWMEADGQPQAARLKSGLIGSAVAGMFLCLSSPYTFMFYVVLLPSVVNMDRLDPAAMLTLIAITLAALALVFALAIVLSAQVQRLLTSPARSVMFTRAMATMIATSAIWLIAA